MSYDAHHASQLRDTVPKVPYKVVAEIVKRQADHVVVASIHAPDEACCQALDAVAASLSHWFTCMRLMRRQGSTAVQRAAMQRPWRVHTAQRGALWCSCGADLPPTPESMYD